MKKNYLILTMSMFFMHSLISDCVAQKAAISSTPSSIGSGWTLKNPFDRQIFIENKGQFDADIKTDKKILFQAMLGNAKAYFTPDGVVYRYDEYPKNTGKNDLDKKDKDDLENVQPIIHYTSYSWKGSDPDVTVEAKEKLTYYYTYPTGTSSSINVNVFKKLVYHNIYPGIDVEYSFIPGKPGIKYSLIVHPDADVSLIKLLYSGSPKLQLNSEGDALAQTEAGEITDHAPDSYYQKSGQHVASSYKIENGNEESFSVNAIAGSDDNLVIDPWTTNPNFTSGSDNVYDVDYDNAGNVYAYGSKYPFQLTKFNSAGVQQWTFSTTQLSNSTNEYGDFAVDKITGTCYVVEGFDGVNGCKALKINTLGTLLATYAGNPTTPEMWRAIWNPVTRQIVIGAGGATGGTMQSSIILDTNMTIAGSSSPCSGGCHGGQDVYLMALDPTGSTVWMVYVNTPSGGNSSLLSLPLPALTPPNYTVASFAENELGVTYTGTLLTGAVNAMNGGAASSNWLYLYNGATLQQINKSTGAVNKSVAVTATSDKWGGLDVDPCDNIYAGENSAIKVYNSSLTLQSTITLSNTVYDVVLDQNNPLLYAGGIGFVSAVNVTPCSVLTGPHASFTSSDTTFCNEAGECIDFTDHSTGNPTSWSWKFPGAQPDTSTMQNPMGICYYVPGTYSVSLTVSNAGGTDSIIVNPLIIFGSGAAAPSITVKGGDTLYCNHEKAYQWYFNGSPITGATDSFYVATQDGSYNVYITDVNKCSRLGNALVFTDVMDLMGASQLEIYPNPAGNQFTIHNSKFTIKKIEVYNVLGEIIFSPSEINNPNSDVIINSSSFAKGVYLIELTTENRIYRAKVMKE